MMQFSELPETIASHIKGLSLQRDAIGVSGDRVYALGDPERARYYLKIGTTGGRIASELNRLLWLQDKMIVPEIICFEADSDYEYLLVTAIPGLIANHEAFTNRKEQVVIALAKALRNIHSIDIAQCPFDCTLPRQIDEATANTEAGIVDEGDFDAERLGRSANDLLLELHRTQPASVENVFTHGDYCLPNVLLDPNTLHAGFIDVGRAGISDRYLDLSIATRSITHNFGPGFEEIFLEAYGLDTVDRKSIEFYRLLDEFF